MAVVLLLSLPVFADAPVDSAQRAEFLKTDQGIRLDAAIKSEEKHLKELQGKLPEALRKSEECQDAAADVAAALKKREEAKAKGDRAAILDAINAHAEATRREREALDRVAEQLGIPAATSDILTARARFSTALSAFALANRDKNTPEISIVQILKVGQNHVGKRVKLLNCTFTQLAAKSPDQSLLAFSVTDGDGDTLNEVFANAKSDGDMIVKLKRGAAMQLYGVVKALPGGKGFGLFCDTITVGPPVGKPARVDLLELVNVSQDTIRGAWRKSDDGLSCDYKGQNVIRFPYRPPAQYDLNVEFERRAQLRDADVMLVLAQDGSRLAAEFGGASNTHCGFHGVKDTPEIEIKGGPIFEDGKLYRLRVEVRAGTVTALIDDKVVAKSNTGSGFKQTSRWIYVGEDLIGLATWNQCVFRKVEVTEIGNAGTVVDRQPLGEIPSLKKDAPKEKPARVVNLLPLIDPSKDAINGSWSTGRGGGGLTASGTHSRLRIPYEPPEEYDFVVRFSRRAGEQAIVQCASIGGKPFEWLTGGWDNSTSGFERIAGASASSNATTVRSPASILPNRSYTSTVHVRRGGISASIDGKLVAEHLTDGSDLGVYSWWFVGENVLGLGADSAVQFETIEIREITGQGRQVAHIELPALDKPLPNDRVLKSVDLLALLDAQKDSIAGNWNMVNRGRAQGKGLLCGSGSKSRIKIPYRVPDEYDLRVVLQRYSGDDGVAIILSHDGHDFRWMMGTKSNRICGFDLVGGRFADSLQNPTRVRADAVLRDLQPVEVIVYVRKGSVSAAVDGKLVSVHTTDFGDLSLYKDWKLGDNALGLGAENTTCIFQAVELREITGEGAPLR